MTESLASLSALLLRGFYTTAFQPVIDTATSRTAGYESLLRGPEGTALENPGAIFSDTGGVPEETRLSIDRMALESAIRTARNLPEDQLIFINVLGRTLEELEDTLPEFLGLLDELRIHPSRVVLELSETTGRDGADGLVRSIAEVRRAGVRLALDDIGVRSPYLFHLLAFEPEFLKIDRIFIQGIDADCRKQDLMSCMVQMAGRMGARLVAEGIETAQEMAAVRAIGVPLSQGFYLGRPQAAETWQYRMRQSAAAGRA